MSSKEKKNTSGNRSSAFAVIAWILFVASAIWFTIVFRSFDMFPANWLLILITVLAVLGLLTGWVVYSRNLGKTTKILSGIVNVLLCVCLVAGSLYLPYVRSTIEKIFTDVEDSHTLSINYYVLTDEYLEAHPDIYDEKEEEKTDEESGEETGGETGEEQVENGSETVVITTEEEYPAKEPREYDPEEYPEEVRELIPYLGETFLVQKDIDKDNQDFAMEKLAELFEIESFKTKEYNSLWNSYDALLNGEGKVLVMNSTYEDIVSDIKGYEDFKKNTRVVYTFTKIVEKPVPPEVEVVSDAFSVLIAGNDTYGGISTYGRTDVVMIATINPKTKQAVLVSFPRDSYMGNPAYGYRKDKLTHMGVSGIGNTMAALSNYTGVNVEFYAMTNFTAFVRIIDALGGVDIYNPYTFSTNNAKNTWDGVFYEGNIHLDGTKALAYCRERFNLPNGDFGRAEHENIVMRAIMNKLMSSAILTNFNSVLNSMSGMVATNFPTASMFELVKMQLNDMQPWHIVSKSLKGSTGSASCAAAGGEMLSCVFLYDEQINEAISLMNKVINGEILE